MIAQRTLKSQQATEIFLLSFCEQKKCSKIRARNNNVLQVHWYIVLIS